MTKMNVWARTMLLIQGKIEFFLALRSFWAFLNLFNPFGPTFDPFVRLGLAVMVDLILGDGNGKNNLECGVRETQLGER